MFWEEESGWERLCPVCPDAIVPYDSGGTLSGDSL